MMLDEFSCIRASLILLSVRDGLCAKFPRESLLSLRRLTLRFCFLSAFSCSGRRSVGLVSEAPSPLRGGFKTLSRLCCLQSHWLAHFLLLKSHCFLYLKSHSVMSSKILGFLLPKYCFSLICFVVFLLLEHVLAILAVSDFLLASRA